MKALGYISAFLGGAVAGAALGILLAPDAGAALGILLAPEAGEDTRNKLSDAVKKFCDKHDIKLTRKQVDELIDDVQDADIA